MNRREMNNSIRYGKIDEVSRGLAGWACLFCIASTIPVVLPMIAGAAGAIGLVSYIAKKKGE